MDKRSIIAAANANSQLMDGSMDPVIRILEADDIVFAVWEDATAEEGVSTLLLKGRRRLEAIASEADAAPEGTSKLARGAQQLRWSAVMVSDLSMAVAARETVGESEQGLE